MYGSTSGCGIGMRAMTQQEIEEKIRADLLAHANRQTAALYSGLQNVVRQTWRDPDVIGGPKRVPDVPAKEEA